jgi:hypothetical protein
MAMMDVAYRLVLERVHRPGNEHPGPPGHAVKYWLGRGLACNLRSLLADAKTVGLAG